MYSDYYIWLDSLVQDGNHLQLIRYLYEHPYRWQFTLDENRAAGGLNLRSRYAYENGIDICDIGLMPECSILEMLIALSDRMVEVLSADIRDWFWVLLQNLGLDQYDDEHFDEKGVFDILEVWLDRRYDSDGMGSLFPLSRYSGDCRNLDTWGQMNAWIEENFPHNDSWLYT
jgi:hypothetical protein